MNIRYTLLASAALVALPAVTARADAQQGQPSAQADTAAAQPASTTQPATQAAPPPADTGAGQSGVDGVPDEPEIVVVGQKPRGSVVGDIPPENTLDARDVRATGATNINELLDALAPQIGSTQGRGGEPPVLLLNGQRISSFRELRDIPTEAIQRVEILPEEVALKYGYSANQKVVNIVLRQRFRSTVAQLAGTAATEGGYGALTGDVTRLMIQRDGRTQFNLHATGNNMLTENERDIIPTGTSPTGNPEDLLSARSLIGEKRDFRGSSIVNREIGSVAATLNTEVEHTQGLSLIGLGENSLLPLPRDTTTDTAHAGVTLNWNQAQWHWNVVGNADWEHDWTSTARDNIAFPHDRARETTTSTDLEATTNGNIIKVPAGNASTTLKVGVSMVELYSQNEVQGLESAKTLGRSTGTASANLDLPISRRGRDFSALGNLTINGNAEVDQLSDFGTLTKLGAGANWSPVDRLNFVTSWTREEGPPTVNQLGDPLLSTPQTRIFDFNTGQTVLATVITGGNPNLQHDRRTVFKLGGYWQPFQNTDLKLRADYVHQRIDNAIESLTVTPKIEQAFPDRFVRCAVPSDTSPPCTPGQLISADLRPVNFDHSETNTLRIGFDFTKRLKSHRPSPAVIEQLRQQFGFGQRGGTQGGNAAAGQQGGPPPGPPPEGGQPPNGAPGAAPARPDAGGQGGGGFGGRGGGRGGGFFGGGNGGRLQFSLTDTITFVNKVQIRPGIPELDYLHGDAVGQGGGTPRHVVQAQGGWFNNGWGVHVGANWQSATNVTALTGDNLHFSPVATFDLRLFANFGDMPEVTVKHTWLRGSSLRLDISNIFDSKPRVHDVAGNVPLNYQPDLLNPLGRTIMISFRKLFLPPASWFRQQFQQERLRQQQQQQQPQQPNP
jgi:hypothetical protein